MRSECLELWNPLDVWIYDADLVSIKPLRKESTGHPKGKPMETAKTSMKIIVLTDSE
jgi:hypothetical protein